MQKKSERSIRRMALAGAFFLPVLCFFVPSPSSAIVRNSRTECYIKDIHSDITVQKDSSLFVDESILLDCGDLEGKGGVTRTIPEIIVVKGKDVKTPVSLISVKDSEGRPLPYSVSKDNFKHSVSWEIQPSDDFAGESEYEIVYSVKNAVLSEGLGSDEFYWNIDGGAWGMEIDNFSADISFPAGADKNSGKVYLYSSDPGTDVSSRLKYDWVGDNTLNIVLDGDLFPGQKSAVSISFPNNVFKIYEPSFIEKYGESLWFFLPLAVFALCYFLWEKYGRDPKINKPVVPQFQPPENLTPMEVGVLESGGDFKGSFVASAIIDLAVKGYIHIEEIDRKWYAGGKDYKLKKVRPEEDFLMLSMPEKNLTERMFRERREIFLSLVADRFYRDVPYIKRSVTSDLALRNLMTQTGSVLKVAFIVAACVLFFLGFFLFMIFGSASVAFSVIISVFALVIFAFFMPKRTPKGAEFNWAIKGMRKCIDEAFVYSNQISEKKNIFEKMLPYAMVFGRGDDWAKRIEEICGRDYFQGENFPWYTVSGQGISGAEDFIARMDAFAAGISASTGAPG